jgi:hypothetical protein
MAMPAANDQTKKHLMTLRYKKVKLSYGDRNLFTPFVV